MTWWRSGSIRSFLIGMVIVAGCQGPGPTTGPTAASPTSGPTAESTPGSTPTPTAAPSPTSAGITCPSPLPTDVEAILRLDSPSCFGTNELSIEGWLDEDSIGVDQNDLSPPWTIASSSLYPSSPLVSEFMFDFMLSDRRYGMRVVAPPESGIDLMGTGRWVSLRGHFNDPVASACTFVDPELANDPYTSVDCNRLFVVTGLNELPPPSPACPSDSPLDLPTFFAADAACFIGKEVKLVGWEDIGEGFGGASTAYPIKLDPSLRLADAQLVSRRWESEGEQHAMFPWTIRGSGIHFDRSDVRVAVTGLLGHPAAAGCRPGSVGWTWTPPTSWAQHRCQHIFVITAVRIRD